MTLFITTCITLSLLGVFSGFVFSQNLHFLTSLIFCSHFISFLYSWPFLRDLFSSIDIANVAWRGILHFSNSILCLVFFAPSYELSSMIRTQSLENQPFPFILLHLYLISQWFFDYFHMAFLQKRNSDFQVMCWHHVVTISLMIGSLVSGYVEGGLAIVYLHEISDVGISFLKFWKEMKLPYISVVFVANLLLWIYYRIYVYSYLVVFPLLQYAFTTPSISIFIKGLTVLLAILSCMHFYWTFLLFNILFKLAFKGVNQASAVYDTSLDKKD